MGNQFCKTAGTGANIALSEIVEFLSCEGNDERDDNEYRMERSRVQYQPGMQIGQNPYTGLGPPGNPASPNLAQGGREYPALPGESVVVTHDVMGGGRLPGESMVVTGSQIAQGSRFPLQEGAYLLDQPSPARTVAPDLQPSKSFDVEAPYKVGDRIEIWSTSQQRWCVGTIDKAQGEWVHIAYRGPTGQQISKIMPNGHEHVRFHGLGAWQDPAPPTDRQGSDFGAFGGGNSPQRGGPLSPLGVHPSSPPPHPSQPLLQSGNPGSGRSYQHREELELWSNSQSQWVKGSVHKVEGEWITIAYMGPGGAPMTKIMPNGGHEQLRPIADMPQLSQPDWLSPIKEDQFSPVQSTSRSPMKEGYGLPAPPPATTRPYKAGDQIEIWSGSQNTWCKGSISKVEGDWVHTSYRGPGNQQANKIMPNGHEHLRMLPVF